MSSKPEHPQQPPETTPSEAELAPVAMSQIKIICSNPALVKAVKEILDQPRMRLALSSAFPEPFIEALPKPPKVLKLNPARTPAQGITIRGDEALLEYSERFSPSHSPVDYIQREILQRAIVETTLSGLRSFATNSVLPSDCREEIQVFALALTGKESLTLHELRRVVSGTIRAEHDRLQRQKEKLLKKLQERVSSQPFTVETAEDRMQAISKLVSLVMSISLLVDQPGAKAEKSGSRDNHSSISRSQVVEELERAVDKLTSQSQSLWTRAVFDGDLGHADAIANLRNSLQAHFRFKGFNAALPPFITTEGPVSGQTSLDQLLQGSLGGARGAHTAARFSPECLAKASSYVSQALATTKVEGELRAWSTSDPDPSGFLREELLTIIQRVPAALIELKEKLPVELPTPVQQFIETLCRYRLHGGTDGAAYFASVGCHHTPNEAKISSQLRRTLLTAIERGDEAEVQIANNKVQAFLAEISSSHPEHYVTLVSFLAGWSLMPTTADREVEVARYGGALSALTSSVVYTNIKTLEESFLATMSTPERFNVDTLEQFKQDVAGLAEAAKLLSQPQLSAYSEPVTQSLANLIEVLEVESLDAHHQLKCFAKVKRAVEKQRDVLSSLKSSTDSIVSSDGAVQAIHDHIQTVYESLAVRVSTYPAELRKNLIELDQAGEILAFAERVADGVAVARSLAPSEISTEIEAIIDKSVLSVVNMLGEVWHYELDSMISELGVSGQLTEGLGFSKVSAALSAGSSYKSQLTTLRNIISKSSLASVPVRVNHIDAIMVARRKEITAALQSHPEMILDYMRAAVAQLSKASSRDPELVAEAQQLLDLDLDLRLPKFQAVRVARIHLKEVLAVR